jgi:iron complex outermembrane receptor protein
MIRDRVPFAALLFALSLTPSLPTSAEPASSSEPETVRQLAVMDEVVITHSRTRRVISLPETAFESGRAADLSEAIGELPGVSGIRRGGAGAEPVIRGMGFERVETQLDGLALHGAGPARMDPPASLLSATAIERVEVVKALPSVTLGPAGTGGRIVLSTGREPGAEEPLSWGGALRTSYDSSRQSGNGDLEFEGGGEWLDLRAGLHGWSGGDYQAADGTRVPASRDVFGGSIALGIRPAEGQRISLAFVDDEQRDVDFPSLPMDSEENSTRILTTRWRLEREEGLLASLELRGGFALVDHIMSNRHKPNRAVMQAETESDALTVSAAGLSRWRLGPGLGLAAGIDFEHLSRDATRERSMMMMGMPMQAEDHVWPEARQWDLGGFAELQLELAERWRIRLGGRVDRVESDALDADDPGLEMRSVEESYAFFYGAGAADVSRGETLGSGNLLVEWAPAEGFQGHLGAGISTRAAGVTERYFAFALAPRGTLVGNPALRAEKKLELAAGLDWEREWLELSASAFHAWFDHYILETTIAPDRDVNGDGTAERIRGFSNVKARSYGLEMGLLLRAGRHWSLPLSLSWLRARNTSDGRALPEIPPFEARAALRFEAGTRHPWWLEAGARFADRQDRIDAELPEDETPGFGVAHLRGGIELWRGLEAEIGVENLFDKKYREHLTPEAASAVEELAAGQEISAPGRSVYSTLRWKF